MLLATKCHHTRSGEVDKGAAEKFGTVSFAEMLAVLCNLAIVIESFLYLYK